MNMSTTSCCSFYFKCILTSNINYLCLELTCETFVEGEGVESNT